MHKHDLPAIRFGTVAPGRHSLEHQRDRKVRAIRRRISEFFGVIRPVSRGSAPSASPSRAVVCSPWNRAGIRTVRELPTSSPGSYPKIRPAASLHDVIVPCTSLTTTPSIVDSTSARNRNSDSLLAPSARTRSVMSWIMQRPWSTDPSVSRITHSVKSTQTTRQTFSARFRAPKKHGGNGPSG